MSESMIHDVTPSSVTEDLVSLDQVFTDANTRRGELAELLHTKIKEMSIDFKEPRQAEVQLQMVNTYLNLLKDNEASAGRRVTAKLRKTQNDTAAQHSEAVATLLAKVGSGKLSFDFGNNAPDETKTAEQLDAAFEKHNLQPISDTELRVDPKDVA